MPRGPGGVGTLEPEMVPAKVVPYATRGDGGPLRGGLNRTEGSGTSGGGHSNVGAPVERQAD